MFIDRLIIPGTKSVGLEDEAKNIRGKSLVLLPITELDVCQFLGLLSGIRSIAVIELCRFHDFRGIFTLYLQHLRDYWLRFYVQKLQASLKPGRVRSSTVTS